MDIFFEVVKWEKFNKFTLLEKIEISDFIKEIVKKSVAEQVAEMEAKMEAKLDEAFSEGQICGAEIGPQI